MWTTSTDQAYEQKLEEMRQAGRHPRLLTQFLLDRTWAGVHNRNMGFRSQIQRAASRQYPERVSKNRGRTLPRVGDNSSIDLDVRKGVNIWSAVWIEDAQAKCEISHAITRAELQDQLTRCRDEQGRPSIIEGYLGSDGNLVFEVIWLKDQVECETTVDYDLRQLLSETDQRKASGWRPTWLDAYTVDGIRRYVVIWIKDEKRVDWELSLRISTMPLEQISRMDLLPKSGLRCIPR